MYIRMVCDFSTSEVGLLRQQLKENSEMAAAAAARAGVKLHPKIAALLIPAAPPVAGDQTASTPK